MAPVTCGTVGSEKCFEAFLLKHRWDLERWESNRPGKAAGSKEDKDAIKHGALGKYT